MINYIYNYYHRDYILENIEDKSLVSKDNIKKNWIINKISIQYEDSSKNGFGINISSDWNKKFLNNEYKKLHDDHMLGICAIFIDDKYRGCDFIFDG
jgi:hypothetical protein